MIVAGKDEEGHLQQVKRAVNVAGLCEDFEFVGPVYGAAKEKLYREADIFILPSFSENFGIVIGEALSYGVPVITTHGTPWQSLVTNRCGWWVEIGKEALAEALKFSTSLSDLERHDMGERGRKLVEREFSWASAAAKTMDAYQWILGKGAVPSFVMD